MKAIVQSVEQTVITHHTVGKGTDLMLAPSSARATFMVQPTAGEPFTVTEVGLTRDEQSRFDALFEEVFQRAVAQNPTSPLAALSQV